MGVVDLHDQMISYNRMSFRSKKYYLRLVYHLIDMTIVNGWLRYRRQKNELKTKPRHQNYLCEFKMRLANSLILSKEDTSKKRCRPSTENIENENAKKKKTGDQQNLYQKTIYDKTLLVIFLQLLRQEEHVRTQVARGEFLCTA